jgi:hypothetical protein
MSQFNIFRSSASVLTGALLCAATLSSAQAVQFYKWIDKNGSTHYTQEHPGKNASKIIKTVLVDDTPPPASSTPTPASIATNAEQPSTAPDQANNSTSSVPQAQQPSVTITRPPANHLIQPSQEQSRPAFSNQ